VTRGDIFRLLEASPVLKQVFRRDFAEELCDEAHEGAIATDPRESTSPEGIESLELHQQWSLDTSTQAYTSTQRLHLHEVGFELEADAPDDYRKKGERIQPRNGSSHHKTTASACRKCTFDVLADHPFGTAPQLPKSAGKPRRV